LELPSSLATSVQVPDDTIVTESKDTMQTDVVDDEMVGVSPDDAVGLIENGVPDHVRSPGAVKVTEFEAFATVTVIVDVPPVV
jgi:hypothetical protein